MNFSCRVPRAENRMSGEQFRCSFHADHADAVSIRSSGFSLAPSMENSASCQGQCWKKFCSNAMRCFLNLLQLVQQGFMWNTCLLGWRVGSSVVPFLQTEMPVIPRAGQWHVSCGSLSRFLASLVHLCLCRFSTYFSSTIEVAL